MNIRILKISFLILFSVITISSFAQNAPSNFSGTASGTTITLTWSPENGDPNNAGYIIKAKRTPGGVFPSTPSFAALPITNDTDLTDGAGMIQITDENTGNYNGFTNIVAGARYDFEIYTYDNNSISSAAATTVYTLATEPGGHSTTFTATLNGNVAIDLVFDAANTLANADGYLIYRRSGTAATLTGLTDGAAPPTTLGGSTTLVHTTNNSATSYTDSGLDGGVTYHYVLVPFNYDGVNDETYNFLTDGSEPRANATTNLIISMAELTGGVAVSPLNTGSTDQAILGFSITTNGPTTFNALNVAVTSTPVGKFTSPRIFKSANATYGGDASINSGSLTPTQLQFASVGDVLTAGTTNYFIVINVSASASGSIQPSFTQANATFTSPSGTAQTVTITGDTYTFVDATPPTISSSTPVNGATGVSVLLNTFTITFDESVAFVGDNSDDANRIRIWDDDANAFVETIEVADVSVVGSGVTFTTDFAFAPNTRYDIVIGNSVFEDLIGNDFPGLAEDVWEFQTEAAPNISSLSNTTRCIGDQLTINGSRFTGTGGSGNTKPLVRINGVLVDAASITSYSSTTITLTIPDGVSSGNVTVENQDNLLTSNGVALTVHPRINTGLAVTPSTLNPAQNTSVIFSVDNTQTSFTYSLIANSTPGGYTATTQTTTGDGSTKTLTTSPVLSVIGNYTYRIDVSRTGCTTKTLSNTPITVTVASLTVTASATNTTVCNGDKIILIGSVSGGTGFYQFKWTSNPAGFNSTSSSPEVTPTANIKYILEVKDNANNIITDDVDIVVNPKPTVTFVPAPLESTVRTNYTLEDKDYQLYSSLAGGVFTGPGVTLKNDGNYYFNPFSAGVGTHNITLTYTDGVTGCQDTDVETFSVSNSVVDGLESLYCKNRTTDTGLKLSINGINAITSKSLQLTRIRFYYNGVYYDLLQNPAVVGTPPTSGMPLGASYPLTVTSVKTVTDIQTLASTTIPDTYSINIQNIINGWGYGGFYLDVFAKNNLGTEQLVTWQYFRVVDNQLAPAIVGLPAENICSDISPVTLSSSITGYAIEQFTINPAYTGSLSGTKSEIFNPGHSSLLNTGLNEDLLTIQMNYKDLNNCPASVTTNINWVSKPKGPIASDVDFCQVVDGVASSYTIKGAPNPADLKSTPIWYDAAAPSVALDEVNWEFTAPGVTGLIPLVKTYLVQQQYKGCKGVTTSVDLEIKPAPGAAFTPGPICQGKDFNLTGPIDTGLGQPYTTYEWNFGDSSPSQVVSGDENITYNYVNDGNYNIRLTVTNNRDCQNSEIRSITVGLNPKPTFTFKQVCEGDLTEFTGSADIGVEKYEWDFGDGTTISKGNSNDPLPPPLSGTYANPKHTFTAVAGNASGNYNVKVTSYTNIGCSSSLTKVVTILDTLVRTTLNPYLMANEGGGNGLWRLEDVNGNSTWEFAQPTTTLMKEFTSPAWVTNADGFYVANEKSYMNSPCLNISDIERPIISLDLILDTDKNIEGAVLEYSKDNGNTWLPLGAENSGLNWFNTTGFRIGNIGNSPVGWSGLSSKDLNDNPDNKILVQARRALDNLPNLSKAERSKLRFRIAFATTADAKSEFEGIGFNNLSISTRDRISLLEMFTNVYANNYTTNNNIFKAIAADEIAKIQYHVTYSGDDTKIDANAVVNKVDPAARAAYYGIPMNDQYIPRTYVDGYSAGTLIDGNWAITEFNKQSLQNAQYIIKIDSMKPADDSYLKMKVTVEAKTDIPAARNHVLHIAVVEKVVGSNEFVLRKMVPDVNGHELPAMIQTDVNVVIDSVQLDKSFVDVNNLAIIAFVQDERSREVYQAAVELEPGYLPELITGIELVEPENVNVYPNPASHVFRVELPLSLNSDAEMFLVDQVGRRHHRGLIRSGQNAATVNVEGLTGGIYILEIGTTNIGIIRKKIMIVNQE